MNDYYRLYRRSKSFVGVVRFVRLGGRLAETESVHFLNALSYPRAGTSTNKWLRIVHNRAFDLGWLSTPVMARKAWPALRTKRMETIARKQHEKLIETELDPEFRHYLEMLWETGGSQTDIARLHRDNIDEIKPPVGL
jgi:hypothetical protein